MQIKFELNELASPEVKRQVEATIRDCISSQADDGDWKVWIHSSSLHHRVIIKGPSQTREWIFLEKEDQLIEPLLKWLHLYPFR